MSTICEAWQHHRPHRLHFWHLNFNGLEQRGLFINAVLWTISFTYRRGPALWAFVSQGLVCWCARLQTHVTACFQFQNLLFFFYVVIHYFWQFNFNTTVITREAGFRLFVKRIHRRFIFNWVYFSLLYLNWMS